MAGEVSRAMSVNYIDTTQPLLGEPEAHIASGREEDEERNQLGTINGVVVPCLLNIMGIILFLRLSWAVGEAGVLGLLAIFAVAEVQAVLTILSVTAIVTNGKMAGGGSYFMISRSLGPELGGAIGFLFYTGYAVSTSFYCIGFGTELEALVFPGEESRKWVLFAFSSSILFMVFIVSLLGAGYFTKINVPLFVVQFFVTFFGMAFMWFGPAKDLANGGRFEGPSLARLNENLFPAFSSDGCDGGMCTVNYVFAVVFPAATGFMEGANLSGDLADPAKSIGKGTLGAVGVAIVNYVALMLTFASVADRDTLQQNPFLFQDACFTEYIIALGILISSCSSALGSLFGGSRVLQALARDDIFPYLGPFKQGSKVGDEPERAVVLTWLIAQICLLIGDLDVVAPVITCFMCLSYACVNIACFMVSISGTPNFRPRFRAFSWHTALLGAVLNIAVMIYLNYKYSMISIAVLLALVVALVVRGPESSWGDVRQAILFHQVRKYLLRLDQEKPHQKLWRPHVLFFSTEDPSNYRPLVRFANYLKKGGVYVLGQVVVGKFGQTPTSPTTVKADLLHVIQEEKVKAFPQVALAPDLRQGYQNLLLLSGLGALNPNTVVLVMEELAGVADGKNSAADEDLGAGLLRDTLALQKNVFLACGFSHLAEAAAAVDALTMDLWLSTESVRSWNALSATPMLLLQLGWILSHNPKWPNLRLRVFLVAHDPKADEEADVAALEQVFMEARIDDQAHDVVHIKLEKMNSVTANVRRELPRTDSEKFFSADAVRSIGKREARPDTAGHYVHEDDKLSYVPETLQWVEAIAPHLKQHCTRGTTFVALIPLPAFEGVERGYMDTLRRCTASLPPVAFVASGEGAVMTRDI